MEELDEHINNGGGDNDDNVESSDEEDNYDKSIILGILECIKTNDPTVSSLRLDGEDLFTLLDNYDNTDRMINRASDFCKNAGDWIANNTHLRYLVINIESIHYTQIGPLHHGQLIRNYLEFLELVARNKSITALKLVGLGLVDPACNANTIEVLAPLLSNTVCKLSIDECSDKVLQQLSSVLYDQLMNTSSHNSERTLRTLNLQGTDEDLISDNAASGLVTILSDFNTLEKLSLDYTTLNYNTCLALSHMLKKPNCVLKELSLQANEITNHWFPTFAGGLLDNNNTIEMLDLSGSDEISPQGWLNFFNILQQRPTKLCSLSTLYLGDNNINDAAAVTFSDAFTNNSTLERLFLSGITSITTSGWQALAALVRNPESALHYINFENSTGFGDDALLAWVNTLSQSKNATLRSLLIPHEEVTSRGWLALENLVCNKTTIDTLYDSNHTLGYIAETNNGTEEIFSVMRRIVEFRQLSWGHREVAHRKIIHFYFMNGEANMQELIDMELNVMVHAIARIGSHGGALLYQLIRSVPSLFDISSNTKKRKADVVGRVSVHNI